MPRAKKPAGTAADPRNGAKLTILPGRSVVVPDAPDGLLVPARTLWTAYWNDAISGLVQPSDMGLVERWIRSVDEWHRATSAFRKERLVEGSMGQPRLNPLAAYISQLESAIEKAEDRLGLHPKARLALGIQVGEAQRTLADLNADLEDADDDFIDIVVVDSGSDTGTEGRPLD